MPTMTVRFGMDNAAFDPEIRGYEVARIFRQLAQDVEGDELATGRIIRIRDVNGNRVGYLAVEEEDQ